MHRRFVVALLPWIAALVACDGPTATQSPAGPSSTTEFHVSVMNACSNDVLIKLADAPNAAGREQLLIQNQRDTITGTREQLYLMGAGGEVLASYRPVQGKQKLTVSSDCSALTPEM